MFGENKDKLLSEPKEKSIISEDFTIEGLVNSAGEVELGGSIKGPVNVRSLIVKEKGSVIGEVNAETVEIAGYCDGKVSARNVIINGTGEMKGDIEYTELLRTEDGATVDGYVKKVPLVSIENKVTSFLNTSKEPRREKQKKIFE
jgi:cytoskeletal protein CcmA (bactofilin family)|tara:strand:+ start:44 stop:478 length:435 start_codon:yes stop_codon:yes gene_type:complete